MNLIEILKKIINYIKKLIHSIFNTEEQQLSTDEFYKKEYLLTQNELKFYKTLKQITDKMELTLFCQVPVYELINAKSYKAFNKIRNKTIDFVITEKNCRIKCCIELDDSTHNQTKRIERDNFINEIFEETETKLIRFKVHNNYNIEEIEKIIKDSI